MRKTLFTFLSLLLLFSCNNRQEFDSLTEFITDDAAVIIQTSNLQKLQKELNTLSFLNENDLSIEDNIQENLGFLKFTDSLTQCIISITVPKKGNLNFTLISKSQPDFQLDSIQNKSDENIKAGGLNYRKLVLEGKEFYISDKTSPFIVATSEAQLRKVLKKENILNNKGFTKIYQAISPNKTSVILNHAKLDDLRRNLFAKLNLETVKNYAGWSAVDLEFSDKGISFNGLSIPKDKSSLHQIVRNTGPVTLDFAQITPEKSVGFSAIGYKDSEIFLRNLKEFRGDSITKTENEIILNSQESGIIVTEENSLLAIKTLITTDAGDLISGYAELQENYREYPIYKVREPEIFEKLFIPIIHAEKPNFVAAIDEYLVFSSSIPQLRELIADYLNQNTIANQSYYKESEKQLAQQSSVLMVVNTEKLKTKLAEAVSKEVRAEIKNLNFGEHRSAILQLVEEDDFAHIHATFEAQNNGNTSNIKAEEILSVTLEADLLTEPVLVKNHLNNQMDIAVQDINNTLYLISNRGTIFWKKKLGGPILGEIQQVDLFKNGKIQFAFATPYSIEVLDRNGNNVKPFPLKFQDQITQPLSLFDYDNNRKYRFLITQNDEILMYDKNGKGVKGFDFRKTNSEILLTPKHIRIQNKDYIVFPEKSGKLNILSRQGEHRVEVKENIDFSKNQWYEYENDFVSSNSEGSLIKITQTGQVNIIDTELSQNHGISARPNLLVSLSENNLKIKEKVLNLDYGLYTDPEIFYINDKYYISTTDLQTKEVYVFDSNGELLPGFPVYGTSRIDLNNADIDQRPEFVVKGGEKEVLIYKL
ncbi:hypothetical protein DET49_102248 [Salegentibacter sp. 24]|uniref:hypothetical protein n=1 Tax=Salegentibacter sp. 24 TaxID=2183986 RepID=UPI00106120F6|nr:hypothetical protein [Salegentibacter sp. 24]TDN95361.1 hypothetical protein DET49_102248 [Salegentibacter sp. 24]